MLSWKPLVAVGLLSYSLYLAHWPIAVFLRYITLRDPTLLESVLIIAASFVLAWFSWRFVEQPFRRRGNVFPRRRLFAMASAAMVVMTGIGLAGMVSGGFAFRYPDFRQQTVAGQEEWKERTCFLLGDQSWRDWSDKDCVLTSGHAETALLWGDSFAAHYIPGIVRNADEIPFNVIAYTAAGCPPIVSYYSFARPHCQEFNRHALDLIKQNDIKTVILSGRWTSLKLRGVEEIRSTIDALRSMGVQTYVIGQSTEFGANVDVLDYRTGQIETAAWSTNIDPGINLDLKAGMGDEATFVDPHGISLPGRTLPVQGRRRLPLFGFRPLLDRGGNGGGEGLFPDRQGESGRPADGGVAGLTLVADAPVWRRPCGAGDSASPAPRLTATSPSAS